MMVVRMSFKNSISGPICHVLREEEELLKNRWKPGSERRLRLQDEGMRTYNKGGNWKT
jgi:hypothetical protein